MAHYSCGYVSVTGNLTFTRAIPERLKPRPHQQKCRCNIFECYKSNDSFDKVECCFDIVAVFGNNAAVFNNNVERNFVLSTKSKQLNMFNLKGQNFTKKLGCCRLQAQVSSSARMFN